jgi:hypothetical protein
LYGHWKKIVDALEQANIDDVDIDNITRPAKAGMLVFLGGDET